MCDTTGPFGGAPICDRTDPHATGHTYSAAWAADRHDQTEARDE